MKLTPDKRFLLRIPDVLHGRLKGAAAAQGISLNQYCIQVLSGNQSVGAGRQDAEAHRARSSTLAADHLARAEARLLALDVLFQAGSWADVVHESHEVVELALRGLLHWARLTVPGPGQDVAAALVRARARLPKAVTASLPRLAEAARRLRRDRDLAFFGADDVTPWEFYQRGDAEPARTTARQTLELVRGHVLGSHPGRGAS